MKFIVFRILERDNLEELGLDGKMILEWILGKRSGKVWTGCIC